MTRPVKAPYRQQQSREDDADRAVGAPPDHELTTDGRRLRNAGMHEASTRGSARTSGQPFPN